MSKKEGSIKKGFKVTLGVILAFVFVFIILPMILFGSCSVINQAIPK